MNLKYKGEKLNLQPAERKILLAMMGRPLVTTQEFVEILWPHPDFQADHWYSCIHVRLNKIRKELERVNAHWKIINVFGRGWMLR
jgi:DNA-binding response OmpR family regulator